VSVASAVVAEFLSDTWVAEVDAALRGAAGLACDPPLVVDVRVRAPGGEHGYRVHLSPTGAWATALLFGDATTPPDVALLTDLATARALHQGAVRAQDAFARGDLKVRGRPEVLSGRGDLFGALARALAQVRERTSDPGSDPGGRARSTGAPDR
jgi:hypothetical protein